MLDVVAGIVLAIWIYLICARGRFWLCSVRDDSAAPPPANWPRVTVIVPARNEAACIGASVRSLLQQDYPGVLSIVVVDDDSSDSTASNARRAIADAPPGRDVTVTAGSGLPPGWTGKLWALKCGIAVAETQEMPPDYVLLTDADIVHAPDSLTSLVTRAVDGQFVLTSLMAKLRCVSLAERSHVPAFVYFFQMLFPFAWVRRNDVTVAAAAGGCMLVSTEALRQCGGLESVRNALIDDCALARKLKARGPRWLGLTGRVHSIRAYDKMSDVRHMIARSAYAQLGFSPLLLAACVAGMTLVFLAPPLLTLFAHGFARGMGLATWLAMAVSFQPMLRFYRLSPLWGPALPAIALLYMMYTLDSAWRHARRRGGVWKGRVHVSVPSVQ
jgi:hopene-associated glycosyltransferase HpnB